MAKRDLDRMRKILLHLEGLESDDGGHFVADDAFFVKHDAYQLTLLEQAGFLQLPAGTALATGLPMIATITFAGDDYLDAIRDADIWEQTQAVVAETGGYATVEITKSLAVAFIKRQINKHTGLQI